MKKYYGLFILVFAIIICFLVLGTRKDDKKIRVAEVTHSIFYAPMYVALENNYFKDEGLDIELILTSGADKVSAAVLSNDVEIGFAGPESTIYVYNGGEENYLVSFAGLTKRDGQFIISRNKEDNFNLENLYDKEILVGRKGGMPSLNFLNALKNSNVDKSKININYSIDFAALSGSFIGGTGDYVNLFEPNATKLEKENLGYIVVSVGKLSGEMPYTTFYARKSFIENNKNTIKKFRKAIDKGLKFVKEHDASEVASVIKKQFNDASLEDIETIVKRYNDNDCWFDSSFVNEIAFNNFKKIMIDADLIKDNNYYERLVDNN